jgi:hypothetical protein
LLLLLLLLLLQTRLLALGPAALSALLDQALKHGSEQMADAAASLMISFTPEQTARTAELGYAGALAYIVNTAGFEPHRFIFAGKMLLACARGQAFDMLRRAYPLMDVEAAPAGAPHATAAWWAAKAGDEDKLHALNAAGANFSVRSTEKREQMTGGISVTLAVPHTTLLMLAAAHSAPVTCLALLAELGKNVKARDADGKTVSHFAVSEAVKQQLFSLGASRDPFRPTSLIFKSSPLQCPHQLGLEQACANEDKLLGQVTDRSKRSAVRASKRSMIRGQ